METPPKAVLAWSKAEVLQQILKAEKVSESQTGSW